ncbi:hypothetical protein [Inquilinus limosus]|uniref:Uncharacterized protein n=1 Tax=Inquilinus limosus TaxID=171674 RepID=A0A211ZS73_9PROT|nr:hypothetical protein [Inquilinus limosus]OWJ68054.1 hypothetical protein BWR60_06340 [Inquilinus limosus]
MNETQTVPVSDAAPAEERAARHLRLLARAAEIQMEVMEAARTEAVEAPQPGIDYCQRIAVAARSLRLTLLLEARFSRPLEVPPPQKARPVEASDRAPAGMRAMLAMAAASFDGARTEAEDAEASERFGEIAERLERPEVAEMVETTPAPAAVARLCREFGLPADTVQWLATADAALEQLGYAPADDVEDAVETTPAPAAVARLCREFGLPADTVQWLATADAALEQLGYAPADDVEAAAGPVADQAVIRRRLRVIMALGAAIQAGTEDEAECDRRFFAMAEQMDRPDLLEIADSWPAAEAVARLCPIFGLPPEEAERWVETSDQYLARLDLPPVGDPVEPHPAGVEAPDTG